MEPFTIAVWGLATFVAAVFFGAREYTHSVLLEQAKAELITSHDNCMFQRRAKEKSQHRFQDQQREHGLKVFHLEQQLKQANVDITCFRAELGLPPRKINRNAY